MPLVKIQYEATEDMSQRDIAETQKRLVSEIINEIKFSEMEIKNQNGNCRFQSEFILIQREEMKDKIKYLKRNNIQGIDDILDVLISDKF